MQRCDLSQLTKSFAFYRDQPIATADPEYCSAAWAVREIIQLTRGLVTNLGDQKRSYIQSLWLLASHPSANLIDPSILMAILGSVELWVLDSRIAQGKFLLLN